jgi:hypothetical protein
MVKHMIVNYIHLKNVIINLYGLLWILWSSNWMRKLHWKIYLVREKIKRKIIWWLIKHLKKKEYLYLRLILLNILMMNQIIIVKMMIMMVKNRKKINHLDNQKVKYKIYIFWLVIEDLKGHSVVLIVGLKLDAQLVMDRKIEVEVRNLKLIMMSNHSLNV